MILHVPPVPTPRPRFSKFGRPYYDAKYNVYVEALKVAIGTSTDPLLCGLEVQLEFVCPRPKNSKFTTPIGDVDNLAKGVMDTLTKQEIYGDDRQVTKLISSKRFVLSDEAPHVKLWITQCPSI